MDLNYEGLLPESTYEEKAKRICELYAIKIRMMAPRAIAERYNIPFTECVWPMISPSIAEHAFMVAQLAVPVYQEFLDLFPDKNIPPEELESEALHHDDAEALTGDAATDVDGITRAMKDAAEAKSIDRQYRDMNCHSYMRVRYKAYEAKDSYVSKFVKILDAVDLVLFAQYCVRNGVGMISQGSGDSEGEFLLQAFDKQVVVDRRTHGEIREYFDKDPKRQEVSIAEIMYDHSLLRIVKLECPELTGLFKLLCAQASKFPFEKFSLVKLPMDFAKLT